MCKPLKDVVLQPDGTLAAEEENQATREVLRGGAWNAAALPGIEAARIPVLAVYNDTVPLWYAHTGGDCAHFCAPGGYEVWVWKLWRLAKGLLLEPAPGAAAAAAAN